ncbi:MAG TPA: MBL fold metallo-hydrolase [Xanthomonadales bacterium]|nr:MBL fold metallo-hydrolase [Xanthomonadales bacterium]
MPEPSHQPSIEYEFDSHPDIGQSIEILPGIRWLRMPLPFMLGHINLWLLQDGAYWTVVDTGLNTPTTQALWQEVLAGQLHSEPVSRVVVTHLHPDHVGCAGWLTDLCRAPLWMSREEYLLCRILVADTGKPVPAEGIQFYSAAGFPVTAIEHYEKAFGSFGKVVSELPQSYQRITDGMSLTIGEHSWKIVVGRGHSVEHACLFCAELNTLISGDQILPTISSNVSVYPTEPAANPLADWLDSLAMLKSCLPPDVLVLPAHGRPFRGAQLRLDQIIAEHQDGLDKLQVACCRPLRAIDAFPFLFKSEINHNNLIMAAGEAIAHLNYLQNLGTVRSWLDAHKVRWYQSVDQ